MKQRLPIFLGLCLLLACDVPAGYQQRPIQVPGDSTALINPAVNELIGDFQSLTTEIQELAKPNKVQAWVDQLIVKAQPGKNMPDIARMREGEVATYLKQRTIRKSEYTLRGQRYYEPWLLIRTKDSLMGWVHQGGVRFVQPNFLDWLNQGKTSQTRSANGGVPTQNDFMVIPGKRAGNILLASSETELVRTFGTNNLIQGVVRVPPGQNESCTILFPNTVNEVRITWKDATHTQVRALYFSQPNSQWVTDPGIHIGMSLFELTKANQAPVKFYGFNWDYSGVIESWGNGKIKRYGKHFYVVLSPIQPRLVQDELGAYQGNQIVSSNTKGVEELGLVVSQIVVYLD